MIMSLCGIQQVYDHISSFALDYKADLILNDSLNTYLHALVNSPESTAMIVLHLSIIGIIFLRMELDSINRVAYFSYEF